MASASFAAVPAAMPMGETYYLQNADGTVSGPYFGAPPAGWMPVNTLPTAASMVATTGAEVAPVSVAEKALETTAPVTTTTKAKSSKKKSSKKKKSSGCC
eukprot:TRINITY_DN614_c2_g1_i3.p2 TRINITY_DN614_c2_g1~~TRINITY_DN614_c2_g1_i3.p2  ORF type:complete len:100 (+),score=28.64 TRINITY_DN614_c2_g1_i3:49-348(+)